MQQFVTVRQLEGKKLLGVARQHAVITDRRVQDGGGDLGCTSGELLLLAIGSCVTGSLRNFFEQEGRQCKALKVEVGLEPSGVEGARDRIVIALYLSERLSSENTAEAIRIAATSGAVASRLRLGSEVDVRIVQSVANE